ELVRAEPQRGTHRRVELADRPTAERLDRVVERAYPLHGAVREPLRERAVATIERRGGGAERAVRVRVVLEDAHHRLVRRAAGRGDAHVPILDTARALGAGR